ncbi:ATP-binding protein [Kitasatospora sp. NPDC001660]
MRTRYPAGATAADQPKRVPAPWPRFAPAVRPALSVLCTMAAEQRTVREMRALARALGEFRRMPDSVVDDLLLVVSEYVTNAVTHSGSPDVAVKLVFGPRSVSVAVRDTGRWVQPKPPGDAAESGRGTRLCRRLPCVLAAGRHHPARGGTVAWAHLRLAPPTDT